VEVGKQRKRSKVNKEKKHMSSTEGQVTNTEDQVLAADAATEPAPETPVPVESAPDAPEPVTEPVTQAAAGEPPSEPLAQAAAAGVAPEPEGLIHEV
jgi:hypothetical protein